MRSQRDDIYSAMHMCPFFQYWCGASVVHATSTASHPFSRYTAQHILSRGKLFLPRSGPTPTGKKPLKKEKPSSKLLK